MNSVKLHSLIALVTPILVTLVTAFTPQLQQFFAHNQWAAYAGAIAGFIYNNFVTPAHKS